MTQHMFQLQAPLFTDPISGRGIPTPFPGYYCFRISAPCGILVQVVLQHSAALRQHRRERNRKSSILNMRCEGMRFESFTHFDTADPSPG
uniref:Uncharacterized protein n=1 Tax=Tetraselmis sp. GSL018 TaxID=582737 RepID=A0A061RIE2_9CHLO